MDSPDRQGAANSGIKKMRRLTRFVQLAPFAYVLLYALYMLMGSLLPEETLCAIDSVAINSPLVTGGMMVLSKLMNLCRWHKAAVLIPSTSQIEGYIDSFVITFTQEEIFFINLSIGLFSLLFLVLAHKHFFGNG